MRLQRLTLQTRPTPELIALVAVSLPELTHLDTPLDRGLDIIHAAVNLRSLTLSSLNVRPQYQTQIVLPEEMLVTVSPLHIAPFQKGLTSAHMTRLLACTPNLRELFIANAAHLGSLEFLSATKSLAHTLVSLRMERCDFLDQQVRHRMYCLQQLASLHLEGECFSADFEEETLLQLRVPSQVFPKLQQSHVGRAIEQ